MTVKEKLTKKAVLIDLMLFLLNVILLLAIAFLMIELNQNAHAIEYIRNDPSKVVFVVATVLFLSVLTFGYLYFESVFVLTNILKLIEMFVLLDISLFLSFVFGKYLNPAARPFGFFAIMCNASWKARGNVLKHNKRAFNIRNGYQYQPYGICFR